MSRAAAASHPHDDLADLLVRLQVAMSLDDLLEREGLGDDRLQAAISQTLVDETFTTLQPGRVAGRERDLRQPKAAQDDGLSQQLQGGHSRRLRTQGPVDEDDAVGYPCLCAGPCCARAFLRSYSAIAG